ncbi:hypothetical protein L798_05571 [Zootermopsis nevadensis]|uniref:Uncharacterized protein n=1 Tax=Zootermopsis nevadensis TaxID=136037 RepID=A0A067RBA4_ZOONE|nr:hypothetical protein L798_05571 [Zootermopsis nevadensis]
MHETMLLQRRLYSHHKLFDDYSIFQRKWRLSQVLLFVSDQSAQRRSVGKQGDLSLFRSIGSRTALLPILTCSLLSVVTIHWNPMFRDATSGTTLCCFLTISPLNLPPLLPTMAQYM